ncbi:hypothetical protein KSP39_PZI022053 [Platanthera zijinensis]|uniref:CCHC-type domain-containing protein n=1 Tax=Platanthera zijinensis TaxID=2320716 RepID=A0AAP0FVL1_9ASPA
MGRKDFRRKSSRNEDKPRYDKNLTKEIICFGCRKPGHILSECPEKQHKERSKEKESRKHFSKPFSSKHKRKEKGFVTDTWSETEEEYSSSSSSEDEEETKARELCLMAINGSSPKSEAEDSGEDSDCDQGLLQIRYIVDAIPNNLPLFEEA